MGVNDFALKRFTTKVYDATRTIPDDVIADLLEALRNSASSTNSQPWHFVVASTREGKELVAKSTSGFFSFNEPKVLDASHVVVLCSRREPLSEEYLQELLEQEDRDGRFATPEAKAGQHGGRSYFANLHRDELGDAEHWIEKQVYLAAGALLVNASVAGVDSSPMEGFDRAILDDVLGLTEKGLTASLIISLGYHAEGDFNATLPKSRWPEDKVFTKI